MTAKEWLNRGRLLDLEIAELRAERKKVLEQAEVMGEPYKRERMIRYINYAVLLSAAQDRLVGLKNEIFCTILHVEDGTQRTLLFLRYVSMKTWSQVAEAMHYEDREVYRLHKRAITAVEKILETYT